MPPSQHPLCSLLFLQNNAKPDVSFSQLADFNLESEFSVKNNNVTA